MKKTDENMTALQCLIRSVVVVGLGLFCASSAFGQGADPGAEGEVEAEVEMTDEEAEAQLMELIESFGWEREGTGKLGSQATINIPDGYRFTGRPGTEKLMQLYGNRPSPARVGTLAPEALEWFVVFTFDDVGYVKDDEKDELEPDEMLEAFKENQEMANEQLAAVGQEPLYVDGWAKEPFYNEQTNKLEWALRLRTGSGEQVVNYKTRLLGRQGVMDSVLVCGPEELESLLPTYQRLIADFDYASGKSYAEYEEGDRIAEFGLKGLMVGGAAFAAAKLGLFGVLLGFLKKGWILIVAALVAVKSWITKLFSRSKNQYTVDP